MHMYQKPTKITHNFHQLPTFLSHCPKFIALSPNPYVFSHPHNLSFIGKHWGLKASLGLHFASKKFHVHVKTLNKFVYFSPVSLSYVSSIVRPATEPNRVGGSFSFPSTNSVKKYYHIITLVPQNKVGLISMHSGNRRYQRILLTQKNNKTQTSPTAEEM